MLKLQHLPTWLLVIATLVAASPRQDQARQHPDPGLDPLERRQVTMSTTTRTSTRTETETIWAPTATSIKNPLDYTSWITYGVYTTWPSTVTTTKIADCVSYSYSPAPTTPYAPTSTVVVWLTRTVTVASTNTVTVTDTGAPTRTVYSLTFPTVTMTRATTSVFTSCFRTQVESYYITSTRTTTTMPWATSYTVVYTTEVCLYPVGVWVTVDGPAPTSEPYIPAISRLTGSLTLTTIKLGTTADARVEVSGETSTTTRTVCDNPSTSMTSTYYTQTVTPTVTATVTGGAACGGSLGARGRSSGGQAGAEEEDGGPLAAAAGDAVRRRQETAATTTSPATYSTLPGKTPASIMTTTYSTVGLRDNTVVTSMATKIIEWHTSTFTTVFMVGLTVTAQPTTRFVTVC